jgi:4-hydroxy-tetrahydrodipicolinate synthase
MLEGDADAAQKLHDTLTPLFRDCFIESNPIPTKAALSAMGFIQNELRLPLVPASQGAYDQMLGTIKDLGLL